MVNPLSSGLSKKSIRSTTGKQGRLNSKFHPLGLLAIAKLQRYEAVVWATTFAPLELLPMSGQ
jgi:hypothetical protein